jgi:hypothetical protein
MRKGAFAEKMALPIAGMALLRHFNFAVLLLKIFNGFADQINHFSVGRSAFILRNIMQLIV